MTEVCLSQPQMKLTFTGYTNRKLHSSKQEAHRPLSLSEQQFLAIDKLQQYQYISRTGFSKK